MRARFGIGLLLAGHLFSVTNLWAQEPQAFSKYLMDLKQQLAQTPEDETLRLQLLKAYVDAKQYQAALIELDKVKQKNLALDRWGLLGAQVYLGLGRHREAVHLLTELKESSDPKLQRLLLAEAFLMDQKIEKAKALYQAPDVNTFPKAQLGLAQIALYEEDVESAQLHLDKAREYLSKSPKENNQHFLASQIQHFQADLYRRQGDYDKAQTYYKKAIEEDNFNLVARLHYISSLLANKNVSEFIIQANALYALAPRHDMAMYYAAIAHLESQQFDAAQKILLSGIEQHPKFAENYLLLARSYFDQQQYLQAEQYIKSYIQLKPNHAVATKLLAAIYIRLNRGQDALALLKPLEKTQSEDVNFLSLYGTALLLNKKMDEAQKILVKAQSMAQDNPVIATELAITHLSQGEHGSAEALLQKLQNDNTGYIQADVLLVLSYIQSKAYSKAEEAAKKIIAKKENHPAPYNLLGMVYEQEQKFDLAKQYYLESLKRDPNFILAQNNLTELYLLQENYDFAEQNIQQTLMRHQKNLKAFLLMAYLKEKQGQMNEAQEWYDKAKLHYVDSILPGIELMSFYFRQGEFKNADKEADRLYSRFSKTPSVLSKVANVKLMLKKYDDAFKVFEDWQSVERANPYIDYMLAKISLSLNKLEKAQEYVDKSLALNESYIPSLVLKTNLFLFQGQYDKADQVSQKILTLAPELDFSHAMRGKVFFMQKEFKQSLTSFEKAYAISASFENVTAYFDALVANEKVSQAMEMIEGWIAEHPKHVGIRRFVALRALGLKLDDKARQYYEQILALTKGDFVVFNNLAYLYQKHDLDKALDYANKAYELAPNEPKVMDTLGWILVNKKQAVKALPLLEQALRLAPDQLDVQFHLAKALHQIGSHKEAFELVKRSLSKDEPFEEKGNATKLYQQLHREMSQ